VLRLHYSGDGISGKVSFTRSSAIAEGSHGTLSRLLSCQLVQRHYYDKCNQEMTYKYTHSHRARQLYKNIFMIIISVSGENGKLSTGFSTQRFHIQ